MADHSGKQNIETGVAIVGAGHAGVECAFALRAAGYDGGIVLLGDEPHVPYQRPPLSKAFLAGATEPERMVLKAADGYEKQGITLLPGERVDVLDAAANRLVTQSGREIRYAFCVLATGARARTLPGVQGPAPHVIRSLDDALALQAHVRAGCRLLVMGGGYLGLESASTATKLGAVVTVVELSPVLMSGRVSEHTSSAFAELHRQAGIELICGKTIRNCRHEDGEWRVELDGHPGLRGDVLLVAIGAVPEIALAQQAGLACDNGIVVDEACRSSHANIFAVGDCASSHRPALGARARVESVQNALDHARLVAAAVAGKPLPAPRPSTFWSEQQGRRLQMAGLARAGVACEDVVHETAKGWVVERYQEGRLAVVEAVDSPVEFVKRAKIIGQPATVPAVDSMTQEKELH